MRSEVQNIRGRLTRHLAIWLGILCGCASVAAVWANEGQPFGPGNPHGFEMRLPDGWTAVSPEMLTRIRKMQRERSVAGVAAVSGYYAYCRASATNAFDPPYLIVSITTDGRMPDRFWRKLSEPGQAFQQIKTGMRDAQLDPRQLLEASFDSNRLAVRVEMELPTEEHGTLRGSGVTFLTEKGGLQIATVTWPSNHAAWKQTFEDTVSSVRLADWMQYRKRDPMDLSGGATDWAYPIGGCTAMAIGGFVFIRWLRNRDAIEI